MTSKTTTTTTATKSTTTTTTNSITHLILWITSIMMIIMPSPCDAFTYDCVKVPQPPMHGRVTSVSGFLAARLKCAEKDTDLPLNAPGDGGILLCDAHQKSPHFPIIPRQKCLPYRKPSHLRMPATFTFTSNTCDQKVTGNLRTRVLEKVRSLVPKKCLASSGNEEIKISDCQWGSVTSVCGKNYDPNDEDDKQIDVTVDLIVPAVGSDLLEVKAVIEYMNLMKVITSDYLKDIQFHDSIGIDEENGDKNGADPSSFPPAFVSNVKFSTAKYAPWQSSCNVTEGVTVGTNLARHRVASCRGCLANQRIDAISRQCRACGAGYATPGPYSKTCTPCPAEALWGNKSHYYLQCRR